MMPITKCGVCAATARSCGRANCSSHEALIGELIGIAELETGDQVVRFCHFDIGLINRLGQFRRFAPPRDPLAFCEPVAIGGLYPKTISHKTAIFRQVDKEHPSKRHDALEFPDGETILLTYLAEHQHATVLQLPVQPATAAEAEAQKRVAYVG